MVNTPKLSSVYLLHAPLIQRSLHLAAPRAKLNFKRAEVRIATLHKQTNHNCESEPVTGCSRVVRERAGDVVRGL
jgi:hypothetical protein